MERHLNRIEDYEPLCGAEAVERIARKAERLREAHVVHVNSTYYGGGVAEILGSLTLLLNNLGVRAGWRVIQGAPDFFGVTKKMHNALQGAEIELTPQKLQIYEEIVAENALRNHLDHDFVVVHDPQPLPLITHYRKNAPWVWRCHIDLSQPNATLWEYLSQFVNKYDAAIFSLEEYGQELEVPQLFFEPAIDPFSIKNRELSEGEIDERLDHYSIPRDLPLVVQVSRFDRWKDPEGVIRAFQIARREVEATLVLLGNVATDDPEGEQVYHSLLGERDERIVILSREDTALVNALQSRAAVVLQKSLREGFGLTVTEAMWKGAAVVGGNVGGIRRQIEDGVTGFLVNTVEECAARVVQLVKDERLRRRFGEAARESVRRRYLMSRLLEQHLDLYDSFDATFKLRQPR
ncbi:MAG: glycosyltransferase [Acidobacteria bacterium]|nr:glycosyltransferase [Acidobacteriota bacterium]